MLFRVEEVMGRRERAKIPKNPPLPDDQVREKKKERRRWGGVAVGNVKRDMEGYGHLPKAKSDDIT